MRPSITVEAAGGKYRLYRGGHECYFMTVVEAFHHRNGHTGEEALGIILGDPVAAGRFFPHFDSPTFPIYSKEFREYLDSGA